MNWPYAQMTVVMIFQVGVIGWYECLSRIGLRSTLFLADKESSKPSRIIHSLLQSSEIDWGSSTYTESGKYSRNHRLYSLSSANTRGSSTHTSGVMESGKHSRTLRLYLQSLANTRGFSVLTYGGEQTLEGPLFVPQRGWWDESGSTFSVPSFRLHNWVIPSALFSKWEGKDKEKTLDGIG